MKFNLGDRVRIVVCNSPFFGWAGEVTGTYDQVFMTGEKHYHVRLDALQITGLPALLFNEKELAFSD